jgi:hypothetical protein
MNNHFHYATVSEAITALKKQGYTIDFNLEHNCFTCQNGSKRFQTDEFEIADVYRYEGNTDPADEATVYAIESKSGLKGTLVTGYGASADPSAARMLEKMKYKRRQQA